MKTSKSTRPSLASEKKNQDLQAKFKIDQALYPFKSNYIEVRKGIHIHYVDEGKGPVILMLHGNPTWSFLYRKMINELKDEFRVIAPDYPGFGLSTSPLNYDFLPSTHSQIIEEFVSLLNLKDIILVMQDWGGPIGLNIATDNPELIKGMVFGTKTWAIKTFLPLNGCSTLYLSIIIRKIGISSNCLLTKSYL